MMTAADIDPRLRTAIRARAKRLLAAEYEVELAALLAQQGIATFRLLSSPERRVIRSRAYDTVHCNYPDIERRLIEEARQMLANGVALDTVIALQRSADNPEAQ